MKKMNFANFLLPLLFTVSMSTIHAQNWVYHKDFPVNIAPVDIDANNEGTLFMLTQDNRIFYKPPGGSWAEILSGLFSGGSGFKPISPLCISAVRNSNRLIVGDSFSGGIFTTSDFGLNWVQTWLTTNPNTGFHETILELSQAYTPGLFFGASITSGLTNEVIRYSNGGANGVLLNYDPQNNPSNSAAELHLTANSTLLIGTINGGIIASFDNGASFQPTGQNLHQIYRFTEDATGRVYALGYNIAQDVNFLLFSDDYLSWETMNLPNTDERYTTIYCHQPENELWLGSETGLHVSPISTISWANAMYNNESFWAIEIAGDNNGTLYGFSAQHIAQSFSDAQSQWNHELSGLTGTATQVNFGENDRMFAASNYWSNNISVANSATDSWVNVFLGGNAIGVHALYTRPGSKVFASTGFTLKKSIDNGATYSDITPANLTGFITKFYVGESGRLFLTNSVEFNTVYWSQDEGNTWILLNSFPSSNPFFPDDVASIAEDSNGVIYVTMNAFDFDTGNTIHYSTDNGTTWQTESYLDENAGSLGIGVFSKNAQTFATMYGGIYTFDYAAEGDKFQAVPLPAVFSQEQMPLHNFRVNSLGHYYIFGYNLYASTNGGATWQNLLKPTPVNTVAVDDITFDTANNVYLVTTETLNPAHKGIYRSLTTLTATKETDNSSFEIYPNPATDILHIEGADALSVVWIYSVTGNLIKSNTGYNLKSIDVSELSPGLYLLRLLNDRGILSTQKVVITD